MQIGLGGRRAGSAGRVLRAALCVAGKERGTQRVHLQASAVHISLWGFPQIPPGDERVWLWNGLYPEAVLIRSAHQQRDNIHKQISLSTESSVPSTKLVSLTGYWNCITDNVKHVKHIRWEHPALTAFLNHCIQSCPIHPSTNTITYFLTRPQKSYIRQAQLSIFSI